MKPLFPLVLKAAEFYKKLVVERESSLLEQLSLSCVECQLARIHPSFGDIPEIRSSDMAKKNLSFFVNDDGSARDR